MHMPKFRLTNAIFVNKFYEGDECMNRYQSAVAIVVILLATIGVAWAENPPNSISLPWNTVSQIKANPQRAMQRILGLLFTQNANGIFDLENSEIEIEIGVAQARSRMLSKALAFDLNGDLSINGKEIERWMKAGQANQKAMLQSLLEFRDLDGNGDISWRELQAYVDDGVKELPNGRLAVSALSGFDVDEDGFVTSQEIKDVFKHVLSGGDVQLLDRRQVIPVKSVLDVSNCNWPQPSENAIILFLNVNQGTDLTNVTIAGQDRVSKISTLKIESGDAPIYLISSTQNPIIWNVTGNTDRVEHMVLGAINSPAGVSGLAAQKVTFFDKPECGPKSYMSGDKSRAAAAKALLKAQLGRKADWIISSAYLESIALPSKNNWKTRAAISGTTLTQGKARYLLTEDDPFVLDGAQTDADGNVTFKVHRDMKRFNPNGVTELDPASVVASAEVELYEILPQQPGVLQLIKDGALRVTDDDYLFIQKPISRFPAGLNGPQSLRFILGDGITLPIGIVGGSSVVSEKTGECLVKKCFQAGRLPGVKLR